MTKQDVINALGDRPSADELRKMDATHIKPEADEEFTPAEWLYIAFCWWESPQGQEYWQEEYDWLKSQEPKV